MTFNTNARLILIGIFLTLVGCGREGPERVPLSGTVTFRGEPVEKGRIYFFPAEGTMAPMSGGHIAQGRYVVEHKGGVPVGTHRVEIVGFRPDPRYAHLAQETSDVEDELPEEQYIPEKYNKSSELQLTIPAGSGPMTEDFALGD
jgi:hypothetical protein